MATHFYQLRIINRRQETPDCISLAFEVPESLQSVFAFTQGQHLTLRATINGQEVRRNYSLCSSPLEGEWRIAIKRLEGGLFSQYAHQHLQPGQTIEVMPPSGRFFTPLHPDNQHHYVAFCAGSGITPVISIIKTTLSTEPNSQFTLVYANRRTSSIIFKEELEALKNVYMHRFRLVHILSAERGEVPLLEGRIDAAKTRALCTQLLVPQTVQAWFLCGPEGMIFSAKEGLLESGVPEERIHFELFTTHRHPAQPTVNPQEVAQGPLSTITLRSDGRQSQFTLPYAGLSILDAALQQGADLPYACKGGVCCTCKARLVSGQVKMEVHYGLEPDEIAAGYILTCQSHPLTEQVVVDYDG